ncbi:MULTISPECIES: Arm DNA-binding domain-containing protein [Oxalobacteraceae]|uniref:Arm DNA-binding domain-containing protein n=1 Tax=Herminiimonas sp. Marseille-P9896 TaxID=2742211 RepID=UPI00158927CD|nr:MULTISPECIES: Arm DNA-binding domain-containing protein [Oxalobacteraceae]
MVAKAGITVQGIQALSPRNAHYKKSIGDGLYICVASNGTKNWMIRYSVNASQRDFRPPQLFGLKSSDSTLSLTDAKALAATIRALAKQGIDYQIQRAKNAEIAKAAELANTSASLTVNDLC